MLCTNTSKTTCIVYIYIYILYIMYKITRQCILLDYNWSEAIGWSLVTACHVVLGQYYTRARDVSHQYNYMCSIHVYTHKITCQYILLVHKNWLLVMACHIVSGTTPGHVMSCTSTTTCLHSRGYTGTVMRL